MTHYVPLLEFTNYLIYHIIFKRLILWKLEYPYIFKIHFLSKIIICNRASLTLFAYHNDRITASQRATR